MAATPTKLRREIDVPDGWRETHVRRDFLPAPAFMRGMQILCTHVVPDNYVCELTRVEAGVFGVLNPDGAVPVISQIDQLHWWAHWSDQHAAVPLVPAPNPIDWTVHLLESPGPPDETAPPPPNGTIIPVPPNVQLGIIGETHRVWPDARTGAISYAPHKVIVGPRLFGIVSTWTQPPAWPAAGFLPYQLAESWAILEGRTLRYDSEEARRLVLGGLT